MEKHSGSLCINPHVSQMALFFFFSSLLPHISCLPLGIHRFLLSPSNVTSSVSSVKCLRPSPLLCHPCRCFLHASLLPHPRPPPPSNIMLAADAVLWCLSKSHSVLNENQGKSQDLVREGSCVTDKEWLNGGDSDLLGTVFEVLPLLAFIFDCIWRSLFEIGPSWTSRGSLTSDYYYWFALQQSRQGDKWNKM